ncbi:uncharacterized protein LOC143274772 [Babylonia areolata]|uniref:uncharacterized protein LOC143274772 n=1 Tax=Babylonia areolata TaxID=304850 RepID=UPI003FD54724
MQATVLFSCLALTLQFMQGCVGAVTCNKGQITCAANAQCDASDNCQCKPGFNGNGRVHCVASRCTCTAYADPRFTLFDAPPNQLMMKANLPCSVDLVRPTSPINTINFLSGTTACILSYVTAHPEVRPGGSAMDPPFRTFLSGIDMQANNLGGGAITASVKSAGATITPPSSGTATTDADGFHRVVATQCANTEIGFRQTYGSGYVALPVSQTSPNLAGLCGNCNTNTEENVGNTQAANLDYFLLNVAPLARQQGPYADQCKRIATATLASTCTAARRTIAANVCGQYLTAKFGKCLIADTGRTDITDLTTLMNAFTTCVEQACGGSTAATLCTSLKTPSTSCPVVDPCT